MAQYNFGAGALWGTPTTDAFGAIIAVPTPQLLATTQDVSIDISGDIKTLYGQNQFPVAAGRGKGKISGKVKYGQFNGAVLNALYFGQTMTSALLADYADVTGSVIPATPFTITPTPPSTGAWSVDLGVRNAQGNPMTRVASAPTTGQYSVTAGAYLFATADTGQTVFISYQYTATSTIAKTSLVQNIAMGSAPTFRCDFFNQLGGNGLSLTLYSCISSKLSIATKIDDFLIPELDFEAFADSAGRVMSWGTAQ
ncbi:hypothetical protein D3Y57_09785 [Sphingomonas paeninsulae]|uniref:Uncharacterized protein n=1 Tax=Sphingomonas paeninsulae TaxID=2319844 RepID=A0A494TK70_SPHPE|nr:hypothetical protein [Sphingomonas paeninsulae]AYJ86201.1 hypothetical protein D3Y57_09785 [Sphingomonas paeninsulae]